MPCSERPSVSDVAKRQITNTFLKTKYPFKNANKMSWIFTFLNRVFFLLMTTPEFWKVNPGAANFSPPREVF